MLKLNTMTNFQTFNDKMIISTSTDDKKLLLWDVNTNSVVYTYEDANLKNYFSKEKLFVIGKDLNAAEDIVYLNFSTLWHL